MYHKGGDGKPKGFGFEGFGFVKAGSSSSGSSGSGSSSSQSQGLTPASGFAAMSMGSSSFRFGAPGRTTGYHTNLGKRRVRSEEE